METFIYCVAYNTDIAGQVKVFFQGNVILFFYAGQSAFLSLELPSGHIFAQAALYDGVDEQKSQSARGSGGLTRGGRDPGAWVDSPAHRPGWMRPGKRFIPSSISVLPG